MIAKNVTSFPPQKVSSLMPVTGSGYDATSFIGIFYDVMHALASQEALCTVAYRVVVHLLKRQEEAPTHGSGSSV